MVNVGYHPCLAGAGSSGVPGRMRAVRASTVAASSGVKKTNRSGLGGVEGATGTSGYWASKGMGVGSACTGGR